MAVPLGIEPRSKDLESSILTVEIWDYKSLSKKKGIIII